MGSWAWRGEKRRKKVTTRFPEEVRCHNDREAAMGLGMDGLARAISAQEVAAAGQWKPEDPWVTVRKKVGPPLYTLSINSSQ